MDQYQNCVGLWTERSRPIVAKIDGLGWVAIFTLVHKTDSGTQRKDSLQCVICNCGPVRDFTDKR